MHAPASSAGSRLLAPSRLSDRLASLLAAQIEGGELAPGDRLPTELTLAQQHGVSRTVVREAVNQLKSQRLVTSRQGSGVFVAAPEAHKPLAFDPMVLESLATVVQIVEVRRALEGEIAALAAERADGATVEQLRRSLEAIEAAVAAGGDGVTEDVAFHLALADASGNPQFGRLLGFLDQYLREAIHVTRSNEARYQHFADAVRSEHRAIVDAIAAGDPTRARASATGHMVQAARRLEAAGIVDIATDRRGATPTTTGT